MSRRFVTLRTHDRKAAGDALSGRETVALLAAFAHHDAPAGSWQVRLAQTVLRQLRDASHWLACDCRADAPLLVPVLREGQLHLRREGEHDAACPFFHVPEERPSTPGEAPPPMPAAAALPVVDLDARLRQLLAAAGANRIAASDVDPKKPMLKDVPEAYRRIDAARRDAAVAGGLLAGPVVGHPRGAIGFLAGLRSAHEADAGASTHGWFLGLVDAIEEGDDGERVLVGTAAGQPFRLEVFGAVRRQGAPGTEGPFWVLALAGRRASTGRFEFLAASALPAASKGLLLPVLDATDRWLGRLLVDQIRYWTSLPWGANAGLALERPMAGPRAWSWAVVNAAGQRLLELRPVDAAAKPETSEGVQELRKQWTSAVRKAVLGQADRSG